MFFVILTIIVQYDTIIKEDRRMAKNQTKKLIEEIQENFKLDETTADSERNSLATKINTLQRFFEDKSIAFSNANEISDSNVLSYTEYVALAKQLQNIWEDLIRLDNRRCNNLSRLSRLLRLSNLSEDLIQEIVEYEY